MDGRKRRIALLACFVVTICIDSSAYVASRMSDTVGSDEGVPLMICFALMQLFFLLTSSSVVGLLTSPPTILNATFRYVPSNMKPKIDTETFSRLIVFVSGAMTIASILPAAMLVYGRTFLK